MIISSRRRARTPIGRLLAGFRGDVPKDAGVVIDEDSFAFELQKERSRIDRRVGVGNFSLVFIDWVDRQKANIDPVVRDICHRLRITDSIGWHDQRITILLPETDRDGALRVANDCSKVALVHDQRVETEVVTYPWDDPVATKADEFGDKYGRPAADIDGSAIAETTGNNGQQIQEDSNQEAGGPNLFSVSKPTPWWKRATDFLGASVGIVILSPVFVTSAVAIKLSSRGPVFFLQKREGKDGREFSIIKFRTMSIDAEAKQDVLREFSEQDGPAFKLKDDPRVTIVGKYLRKTCIDELPQLFNVLFGQMSLVGPRPLPVHESTACRIWQRKRLEVLPGITCIWQVHGGRDTKFEEWMRMDMEYLKRRSFFYDLQLIFETALVALLHRGSV